MNALLEKIEQAQSIVIYGAGNYSKWLVAYLIISDKENLLMGLTTSATTEVGTVFNRPLLPLSECENKKPDLMVVAMSPAHAMEVSRLVNDRFQNVLYMSRADYEFIINMFKQLPLTNNKILVDCYDGMGYRCNCKYICDYIMSKKIPIEIVWKVRREYHNNLPEEIRQVDADSPEFVVEAYTSKIILTNVVFSKLRPDQYCIWTWHGTGPYKKAGAAAFERSEENEIKFRKIYSGIDLFVSNSEDNSGMYRDDFYYDGEIAEWGYPRNDIFFRTNDDMETIKCFFGIPEKKGVVLYVPTFRENMVNSFNHYDLDVDSLLESLQGRFGKEFIFIYRFHHLLRNFDECKSFYNKGINATEYEDVQELLLIADVLVTDYSSVMWDFSLMRKPVFLYQNDTDEYLNDRGFYWMPDEWGYPIAHTNREMKDLILNYDEKEYQCKRDEFYMKDKSFDDGHACERVANRIMDVIAGKRCGKRNKGQKAVI